MEQTLPLRDIHLPAAINGWPPAIGWWLLLLLIPLTGLIIWLIYKKITTVSTLKSAENLLKLIKQNITSDDLKTLQELSIWLRRVSISVAPRHQVASLTGKEWLSYLDSSVEGQPFSKGVGQYLADAQYRQKMPANIDMMALIELCESWIKRQKS